MHRRDEPTMLDTGRVMLAMRACRMGRLRFPFVPAVRHQFTAIGLAVVLMLALAVAAAGALLFAAFR